MEVVEKNKLMVPELRFREFEGDWNSVDLENVTKKITVGIATEVRPYVTQEKVVPILRNQNIRAGFFDGSDLEYITKDFDEQNKTKRVEAGDLLIVRTGSNTGNACVVPDEFQQAQTFTTLIVRPMKDVLDSQFLSLHFNSKGLSEVQRLAAGGGKPNLNAGFLRKYRIVYSSLPEQKKIAAFLSAVDARIKHLNRKKELLEQYKKGVMQRLFNYDATEQQEDYDGDAEAKKSQSIKGHHNNHSSRQLRFKRADGTNYPDWEEKRLGEIALKEKSSLAANEIEDDTGNYPVYGASGVLKGLSFFLQEEEFIGIVKDGAGVGRVFYCEPKSSVLGTLDVIKAKSNSDTKFVYYLLQLFRWPRFIIGSTIPHIYFKDYSKFKVSVPSKEEQQKIADFLSALDKKIEAVSTQIAKTQQFKKGLLQKMFV